MHNHKQESPPIAIHAIVQGDVQGVGFRYTTQRVANQLGVVGSVRNLPDGSVEIYACASEATLERFFSAIQAKTSGRVDSIQKLACKASFDASFHILYA